VDSDVELRELLERMAGVERMCDAARQRNDVPLLDQAIAEARAVASRLAPGHTHHAGVHAELARCLSLRYRLTGDVSGLSESIDVLRVAVSAAAPTDPMRLVCLNNLGNALADWHQHTGDIAALDEADTSFRAAISLVPENDPRQATVLSALGDVLHERYRAGGQVALLDEALLFVRSAVRLLPPSTPGYAIAANNLANVLLERYQVTADREALEEAASALRSALTVAALDPADRALALGTLGTTLMLAHEATGDLAILTGAEQVLAEALELTPHGGATRAGHLSSLGNVLSDRYRRTGDSEALDRATALYRQAVDAVDASDVSYPAFVSNLANTLSERYDLLGDLRALDEAVALLGHAMTLSTPSGKALVGSNLGAALLRRYQREQDRVVLHQAIYALEGALAATSDGDVRRPMILNNLANALHQDYKLTGDASRLVDAERTYREAAGAGRAGDPAKVMALSNLANVLHDAWQRYSDTDVLAEAVDALRQAARLTDRGHGIRGIVLANLGVATRELHDLTGSSSLADEARQAFAAAAELPFAAPRTRVSAARSWGEMAVAVRSQDAIRAYQTAVELLPHVAPRQLNLSDQEFGLASFTGLAADAAAVALDNGDVPEALRLVEAARGVLIGHSIERQSDLTLVHEHAPHLAEEFRELITQLDTPVTAAPFLAMSPASHGTGQVRTTYAAEVAQRADITHRWNRLLQDIRHLSGLEGFLRPPTASDLIRDAGDGPVVVLNASRHRSDALVVMRGRIWSIPLPQMTPESVARQVLACSGAIAGAHNPFGAISERRAAEDALLEILSWLWDTVAEPVIDALAPYLVDTTRIWWVPTGLLSFLPIHAAGRYDDRSGREANILDRVVSSYAPTVRSHGHARRRASTGSASTLVVGMPETPGWSPLPVAAAECQAVADLVGATQVLVGEKATRQGLLDELARHQHFHFAGHAHGNLSAPSQGRLLLHDHARTPFTVADVARLNLTGAEVAFLSGCDTALSGIELADEAVNFASAFHLAGFRHVVASLWSIDDELAAQVATPVWRSIRDRRNAINIAAAVNEGIRALRDQWRRCPSLWAGYIHVGP